MFLEFTDEQEQLRQTVRKYLADRAGIPWVRALYEDPVRGTTDDVWRDLVDLGLPGILVPEAAGGLGLGLVDLGVVVEEMGRAVHPGPFFASAVVATLALLAVEDTDPLLGQLASGETIATLAIYEPGRRYEWRWPSTTAEATGAGWMLTGAKAHVLEGASADVLLVVAATPDGNGLFAVEREACDVEPEAMVDGTRKQATVTFESVPGRHIVGGDVTAAIEEALDRVRIAVVAEAVGTGQGVLDLTLEYARNRSAFGKPIGSFQAVQHLCVAMYKAIEMSRAAAYYGMFAADAGGAMADDVRRISLIAKTYASDALVRAGNNAIQVHGGVGVTWEHDVHLFYKRFLWDQQAFGGTLDAADELAGLIVDQ